MVCDREINPENRRGNIFYEDRNYDYFLFLLKKYLARHVEILAYCLLPNHFHLLIHIAEKTVVQDDIEHKEREIADKAEIGALVSEQFRRMFISFSQAINRQEDRTGSLFTRNFKRIQIEEDEHLKYLFFYIHYNPEKHGISNDYKNYNDSSYKSYLFSQREIVDVDHGIELFEGIDNFVNFHTYYHNEKDNLHLE